MSSHGLRRARHTGAAAIALAVTAGGAALAVTPRVVDGNATTCADLGLGGDTFYATTGNTGAPVTVTTRDDTYVDFSATSSVLVDAIVVKGGPAYNRYDAPGSTGTGLTAPVNGGGNIPTISHWFVCYSAATTPPAPGGSGEPGTTGGPATTDDPGTTTADPGAAPGDPGDQGADAAAASPAPGVTATSGATSSTTGMSSTPGTSSSGAGAPSFPIPSSAPTSPADSAVPAAGTTSGDAAGASSQRSVVAKPVHRRTRVAPRGSGAAIVVEGIAGHRRFPTHHAVAADRIPTTTAGCAAAAPASTRPTRASRLPYTGDSSVTLGAFSALAMALGAWLLAVGRRRATD